MNMVSQGFPSVTKKWHFQNHPLKLPYQLEALSPGRMD